MAKGKRERAPRALVVRGDVKVTVSASGVSAANASLINLGDGTITVTDMSEPVEVVYGSMGHNSTVNVSFVRCTGNGNVVNSHAGRSDTGSARGGMPKYSAGAVYGSVGSGITTTGTFDFTSKRRKFSSTSSVPVASGQPFDRVEVSGPARVVFTSAELLAADVVVRVSGTARVTLPAGRVRHIDAAASGNSAIVGPADGFLRADTATLTATGRATIHGVRVMDAADASAGPAAAATVRAAEDAAVSARGRVTVTHDQ